MCHFGHNSREWGGEGVQKLEFKKSCSLTSSPLKMARCKQVQRHQPEPHRNKTAMQVVFERSENRHKVEINEQKAEIEELKEEIKNQATELESLKAENEELKARNGELYTMHHDAEAKTLQLESDVQSLGRTIKALKQERKCLDESNDVKAANVLRLETEVLDLHRNNALLQAEVDRLREKYRELKKRKHEAMS